MSTDADNDYSPASQTTLSGTNDYSFRMNQATQMFGDPAVIAAIQDAADGRITPPVRMLRVVLP